MQMRRKNLSRQSRKFSERKKQRKVAYFALIIVSLALVVYSVSALSGLGILQVKNIEVAGVAPDVSSRIKAAVTDVLIGKYSALIPRSNILFYPHDHITDKIKSVTPNIDRLTVKRLGLTALLIEVEPKPVAALVCLNLPDLSAETFGEDKDNDCYFADGKGQILEKSPSFTGAAYHRYYVPDLAGTSQSIVGQQAATSTTFAELEKIYATIERNGIEVEGILLKSGEEYELYAHNPIKAESNQVLDSSNLSHIVIIYLTGRRSLTAEVENLLSFWNKMVGEARARKEHVMFDYIDVRYGSNVFYRQLHS